METRMSGGDVLLNFVGRWRTSLWVGAYLADAAHEPTAMIESHQPRCVVVRRHCDGAGQLGRAQPAHRRRALAQVNDDGSGGMTLHDLAAIYGVSAERIRQIESAAMKKMKKTLLEYA